MCGRIGYLNHSKQVKRYNTIPPYMTHRINGQPLIRPIPFSYWRFMQYEKLESWRKRVSEFVEIKYDKFWESGHWFSIPEDKSMVIGLYNDPQEGGWVCGLLTMAVPDEYPEVKEIHHRMPYLASRWWKRAA